MLSGKGREGLLGEVALEIDNQVIKKRRKGRDKRKWKVFQARRLS